MGSCALLLALPGGASAATAAVGPDPERPEFGDVVQYQAADGERNVVSASAERQPDFGAWTISDTGAVITAVEPCQSLDEHTVRCPARSGRSINYAQIELGDLDDRLSSSSPPMTEVLGTLRASGGSGDDELVGGSTVNVLSGGDGNDALTAGGAGTEANALNGGLGDDRLTGGPQSDELDGGGGRDELLGGGGEDLMTDGDRDGAPGDAGPGPDVFDGGSGDCCLLLSGDRVIYAGRSEPVSVDLADEATDGEAGEGDVLRRVESVEGGSGDDQLFGDERANALIGGAGRDALTGRGGNDTLVPGKGGGRGSCGSGRDVVEPRSSGDQLDADCESLDLGSIGIHRLAVHPQAVGRRTLRYRVECPENEDEEEDHLHVRCSGTVQLLEASGARRLLGAGTFPRGRWSSRNVDIRLTRVGRRLASRADGVLAVVRLVIRSRSSGRSSTDVVRWTIALKLRR